jgi:hypothetical protein
MIDLKGIWMDEGLRFGIVNGGRLFLAPNSGFTASFAEVLSALNTTNYQPLYFLLMNFLSKIARLYTDTKNRDLVATEKRLHQARVAKALGTG